jgi:ElaB/YqjD/DUF883 family membrane-anchored ribosome-binding protein
MDINADRQETTMPQSRNADRVEDGLGDAAMEELSALRDKVEALMRDRLAPAFSDAGTRAEMIAKEAAGAVRESADGVVRGVREQPFLAMGAAALAGIALGLMMRR